MRAAACLLGAGLAAVGCRSSAPDATPEQAESSEHEISLDAFRDLIRQGAVRKIDVETAPESSLAARQDEPDPGLPVNLPPALEPRPGAPGSQAQGPPENPYLVFGQRIVVYGNGLIMKPYPLRIGTGEKMEMLLREYGDFPLWESGSQTVDQVRVKLLKDWDAEQFANLRKEVVSEEDTKSLKVSDWLVVTTGFDRLREVEDFINTFAAGVPQIEIEAKIVEVTSTDTIDLGVQPIDDTTPIFGFPDHTFVRSLTYTLPNSASVANSLLQLSSVQDGVTFNAVIQALQTYDNVSIISQPKVAVREGGVARILNTIKLPSYSVSQIQANGQATATLFYEEIGIKLFCVPRVVGTETVALNIDVEVSQQSGSAATFVLANEQVISNPIISRRSAQTVVYLEPGQAVIIGGLTAERIVDTTKKVPILGDIPILGYLFKSTFKSKEKADVLFFIRPRILQGIDLNQEF